MTTASFTRFALLTGLTAVLAACGGGTEPDEPGPPADLSIASGNAQEGSAGNLLLAPVSVRVTDEDGRAVQGATVRFSVISGGGHVSPTEVISNERGIALADWTLGTSVQMPQLLSARLLDSIGALVDTALITARPKGGPPTMLWIAGGPFQYVPAGEASQVPFAVIVQDQYGNPVEGAAVQWRVASGAATITPATTTTGEDGVARVVPVFGNQEGGVRIIASLGTLDSVEFNVTARFSAASFATLGGAAFGIARSPAGELVTSLIGGGMIERVSLANPGAVHQTAAVSSTPTVVAVDANRAYVANMDGPGLSIVTLATGQRVDVTIPGGGHSLALAPRGDRLYVTSSGFGVYVVNLATREIIDTIPIGAGPWGIAFRSSGTDSLMYVSSRDGASVTEVNMKTGAIVRAFNVGGRPHGLAISPDGSRLYIADNSQHRVRVIRTSDGSLVGDVALNGAFGIAIAPDGATVYVTTDDDYIAIIDTGTLAIVRKLFALSQPRQIVTSADGNTAYAANMGGWISVVSRPTTAR